jgi:hypothetical protein
MSFVLADVLRRLVGVTQVFSYLKIRCTHGSHQRNRAQHEHYIEDLDEHKILSISKTAVVTAALT